jgi:protein MpaA
MRTFFGIHVLICEMCDFFNRFSLIMVSLLFSISIRASEKSSVESSEVKTQSENNKINDVEAFCQSDLSAYRSYFKDSDLKTTCKKALVLVGCTSVKGLPIFHIDLNGKNNQAKNILVFSLIHGDETEAGTLGRYWIERLEKLDSRNNWRVIPILNPDGTRSKTRTNANGIDLNRNFPTLDWDADAISFWKSKARKSERKFPGHNSGSEPEVNCAIKHIADYKPDFVMSIHTPLRVLDFDGPKINPPKYSYLPWKSLGNFPGSLGRFLWVEKNIPVLTTELKNNLPLTPAVFEQLQDNVGFMVQKSFK